MSRALTRPRIAGFAITAALGMAAAGCSSTGATGVASNGPGNASQPSGGASYAPTLNVGQLGSAKIDEALFAASGQDKDLPYAINYSLFPGGGPGFIEAARSGSVDVASMADTPPIFGQVSKAPVTIIAAQHSVDAQHSIVEILVPKDSTVTSVADLKGKKVAVTEGTILQYTVIEALKAANLSYKDIQATNLTPPDAATAFKSGQVDAIAALDPQRSLLLAAGAKKIGDGVGVTAGLGYIVATNGSIKDAAKAADIKDWVLRLQKAEAWADANTDTWAKKYADVTGLPLPVATSTVEREKDSWVPIDDTVYAAQQKQADAYTDLGLIPTKLDVKQEFDASFNSVFAGGAK